MSISVSNRIKQAVESAMAASGMERRDKIGDAINTIRPDELSGFFHASLETDNESIVLTQGLPASPGAASGKVVLSAQDAIDASESGDSVILVRPATSPDDVLGMQLSAGILTAKGGMTSHAAVVARGWGLPAVAGASEIRFGDDHITIGDTMVRSGDQITIDGNSGLVYLGHLASTVADPPMELDRLLSWADAAASGIVQVRTNADNASDARIGRDLGAQGIGLCRTEHMFLASDRLPLMQRFILSNDPAVEAEILASLEQVQVADFESVLKAMEGMPVTVRLLDPPLHEFLPDLTELVDKNARGELTEFEQAELSAARNLHETNPMLGTRGVRLGLIRNGLYKMQVRALCTAASNLFEQGLSPHVEVMIPLVVSVEELRVARGWVTQILEEIGHPELAVDVVTVGAMIETPRAALIAADLAPIADFFSFGTNDLTQMTYAFSRDDVEANLLPTYQELGIIASNPFAVLDQQGVGELVRIGCDQARSAKPTIKLGACGEHAGDPSSVEFLVSLGVDSLSCSPFRVPAARLGVAQSLIKAGRVDLAAIDFDVDAAPTGPATSDLQVDEIRDLSDIIVDEVILLHVLRLRGFATRDGLEESLGQFPDALVANLTDTNLVNHMESRGMYSLTASGREKYESIQPDLIDAGTRAGLHAHYKPFLALNDRLKKLCTAWQLRDGEPNDHSDAEYDRVQITELQLLASDTIPVLDAMAVLLPRLARYGDRLADASARVNAGETNMFTGVMCGSFHDIWMELHEDLILLQQIDRAAEGSF